MPPYKKMYFHLFNAITDALRLLEAQQTEEAKTALMRAQQQTEELYTEAGNPGA